MMERVSKPDSLANICAELEVQPVAEFRGAEKLELGAGGEVPATMYLVEGADRIRFNLKVGHFNEGEVEKTDWLRGALEGGELIRVPRIIRQEPDRFILFEHLKGLPVSRESFWQQPYLISQVMNGLVEIDRALNQAPLTDAERDYGVNWVDQKLARDWVEPIERDTELAHGGLITSEWVARIQAYAACHRAELTNMVRVWRDPNGDHLIVPLDTYEKRLGVVDIDISARPRYYMPMRFLAWSLLKINDDRLDLEYWANQQRTNHHLGKEADPTFVLSLVGILYDLATGERENKHKREVAIAAKNLINSMMKHDGETDNQE